MPRFFYRGLNLLLEGEIDQRKHKHRTNDDDGGGKKDKERGDGQVTKHFLKVDVPEKVHWVAIGDPPPSPKTLRCYSGPRKEGAGFELSQCYQPFRVATRRPFQLPPSLMRFLASA